MVRHPAACPRGSRGGRSPLTFTYNSSSTTITDLSWIRLRIFDTSSASAKLTDEEIANLVATYSNRYLAAAAAAETIAGKFALYSDKTVGKLSISQGSLGDRYMKLAATLRREAGLRATPFAGGITISDKDSEKQDSDRVDPAFSVDAFDYQADTAADSTSSY